MPFPNITCQALFFVLAPAADREEEEEDVVGRLRELLRKVLQEKKQSSTSSLSSSATLATDDRLRLRLSGDARTAAEQLVLALETDRCWSRSGRCRANEEEAEEVEAERMFCFHRR